MADQLLLRAQLVQRRLERELDGLLGGGVLLEPAVLRRLRDLLDEAIPVADAYALSLGDHIPAA